MTGQKQPLPGEWWVRGHLKRFIVGYDETGNVVVRAGEGKDVELGTVVCGDWDAWERAWRCTGFDGVPETLPET